MNNNVLIATCLKPRKFRIVVDVTWHTIVEFQSVQLEARKHAR